MDFNFRQELGKITPRLAEGAKIYIFGTDARWEYVCKQYQYLVNVDLNEYVDGFIDNDAGRRATLFHGKPVFALSEIDLSNAVVIICVSSSPASEEIAWQLMNQGLYLQHSFFPAECFMSVLRRWENRRLQKFRGRHMEERCFVIGNGPSLTADDLDRLKAESTFATNNIDLMFSETVWRPSYYVISDHHMLRKLHKTIKEKVTCPIFYEAHLILEIDEFALTNDHFFWNDYRADFASDPHGQLMFSEDPLILQWGASVTYDCLQLAAYMGFREIYLLGVDYVFPVAIKKNGALIKADVPWHFTASYNKTIYPALIDIVQAAYHAAQEYADSHNIKIYNATRGGALEVFERVDFDSLF